MDLVVLRTERILVTLPSRAELATFAGHNHGDHLVHRTVLQCQQNSTLSRSKERAIQNLLNVLRNKLQVVNDQPRLKITFCGFT